MMKIAATYMLVLVLLGGCSHTPDAIDTTTPEFTTRSSTTPGTTSDPGAPQQISGDFVIANTTVGGDEVGVETMEVVVEVRDGSDSWSELTTACRFSPPAPLVVGDRQAVTFECELADPLPADRAVRAVVLADLFGTDEMFREEIAITP